MIARSHEKRNNDSECALQFADDSESASKSTSPVVSASVPSTRIESSLRAFSHELRSTAHRRRAHSPFVVSMLTRDLRSAVRRERRCARSMHGSRLSRHSNH